MGKTKLNETYIIWNQHNKTILLIYLLVSKSNFSKVSVTIELGCSLLTVHYHKLFDEIELKVTNISASWSYS